MSSNSRPLGMANAGNTCFIASAIQMLLACKKDYSCQGQSKSKIGALLTDFAAGKKSSKETLESFRTFLNSEKGAAGDCRFALMSILDKIEKEDPAAIADFTRSIESDVYCKKCGEVDSSKSITANYFMTSCKEFNAAALTSLFETKELSLAGFLERPFCICNNDLNVVRSTKCIKLPKIALVTFKDEGLVKTTSVEEFISTEKGLASTVAISLSHYGHATCFSKNSSTGEWYDCNDSSVISLDFDNDILPKIQSKNCYISALAVKVPS